MDIEEFIGCMNQGIAAKGGSPLHQAMCRASDEAMKLTTVLNSSYHTPEEIRELFSRIIGKPVDESFSMFPPFYTDCGNMEKLSSTGFPIIRENSSRISFGV